MSRAAVVPALATLALLGSTLSLGGCAWFMKQAEKDQGVVLAPKTPQADGKMATYASQHGCWIDLTYRSLGSGTFDAAPFKRTVAETRSDASGSVWTITGENVAGHVTRMVITLGAPALAVGQKFGVGGGGFDMPPPTATVEIAQGVAPGPAAPARFWTAVPRAEAVEVTELGPEARAMLTVDLAFAPAAQGKPVATGSFSLKGTITVYDHRPAVGFRAPAFRLGAR